MDFYHFFLRECRILLVDNMAAIFFVAVVVLDERLESVKLDDGRVLSGEDDFALIFRGERFFLLYQFDFVLLFFFTLFVNFLSS